MKTFILASLTLFSSLSMATEDPELFEYCEDLPLNTAVKVIIPAGRSKTTTQKYTLVRADEKTYDVYLNLKFRPAKGYDGDIKDKKELNHHYKEVMNSCFQGQEDKLVDEYGRKLRLHIYDKDKDNLPSPPPQVNIKIAGSDHRSNSFAYRNNIECPTMIHEALHLLGLIDEYEEKWMGFNHSFISLAFKPFVKTNENVRPAFDCRAIGPTNSVMHNQWWGLKIYSAHINTIIYPNCKKKNEKYYKCANFAYKTSSKNNGAMPNLFNCAKKVPEYCKDENWVKLEEEAL